MGWITKLLISKEYQIIYVGWDCVSLWRYLMEPSMQSKLVAQ